MRKRKRSQCQGLEAVLTDDSDDEANGASAHHLQSLVMIRSERERMMERSIERERERERE